MKGKYRWANCITCGRMGEEQFHYNLGCLILVCPKCNALIDIDNPEKFGKNDKKTIKHLQKCDMCKDLVIIHAIKCGDVK
jgi:hypothetical protein